MLFRKGVLSCENNDDTMFLQTSLDGRGRPMGY